MKEWKEPTMEELELKCTENGATVLTSIDEVRVDENGRYWFSFSDKNKK